MHTKLVNRFWFVFKAVAEKSFAEQFFNDQLPDTTYWGGGGNPVSVCL